MPILELQKQVREVGRIRCGDKTASGAPNKLQKFRFTSQDKDLLGHVAIQYGGSVRPWKEHPGEYEVYIEAEEVPLILAPQEIDQWYEQWTAGGCTHRCDGQYESIGSRPCQCDPEKRVCKMTTRLWVMLPELPALGTWRLESHGYYAAVELTGAADFLRMGKNLPCTLAIENRTRTAGGKTKKFIVPVLRLRERLDAVLMLHSEKVLQELQGGAPMLPETVTARAETAEPVAPREEVAAKPPSAGKKLAIKYFGGSTDDVTEWAQSEVVRATVAQVRLFSKWVDQIEPEGTDIGSHWLRFKETDEYKATIPAEAVVAEVVD